MSRNQGKFRQREYDDLYSNDRCLIVCWKISLVALVNSYLYMKVVV
jgi:hypothetical protein